MSKKQKEEYVSYIDTDSVFILLNKFLEKQGVDINKWDNLDRDIKIKYLLSLSKVIEKQVNERSYQETQLNDYNSVVLDDDFSIKLKQEIICSNALFLAAKMYAFHLINEEGYNTDRIDAKGIEIVRSSSPTVFRAALKDLLKMVLAGCTEQELIDVIECHRNSFKTALPEDISVNIGVNNLNKYITNNNTYPKGTPYHIKGVAHYRVLLNELGLQKTYEDINEGDKCKVAYLKPNIFGFNIITYYRYPKEFIDNNLLIDYDIMIDKYYNLKAGIFLNPIGLAHVLKKQTNESAFF